MEHLGWLAIFAPIIAFWGQFQNLIKQLFGAFIKTEEIKFADIAQIVVSKLHERGKCFYFGPKLWAYRGGRGYQYNIKYKETLPQVSLAQPYKLFLYGKWKTPVLVTSNSEFSIKIIYPLFLFSAKKLLDEATEKYYHDCISSEKESKEKRKIKGSGYNYEIIRSSHETMQNINNNYNKPSGGAISEQTQDRPIEDNLFFQYSKYNEVNKKYIGSRCEEWISAKRDFKCNTYYWSPEAIRLKKSVEYWLSSKDWFTERNIKHRYGALLHGKTGGGKTVMIQQIARQLELPILAYDLSGMSSTEFTKGINQIGSPAIVLFEDFDCMFEGRENKTATNKIIGNPITFDCLLNTIDGMQINASIFWIVTTNHPEKLDSALLRPGRLDEQIEVGNIPKEGKEIIAKNILRDWPNMVELFINEDKEYTAAEFENKCISKAIELWKKIK